MEIRQCKKCHKLIKYIRSPFCLDCQAQIDTAQHQISEFLLDNRQAGIEAIAEGTGVERSIILQLIREGRLTLAHGSVVHCERCASPIQTGRYCPSCLGQLHDELTTLENQYGQEVQTLGARQANGPVTVYTPLKKTSSNRTPLSDPQRQTSDDDQPLIVTALGHRDRLSGR